MGLGPKKRLKLFFFFLDWLVGLHFSSSHLLVSFLDLHVVQTRMVTAKYTMTLKSNLVFDTRYNDVPDS